MTIKAHKDTPLRLDAIDKKIFHSLHTNYRVKRKKLAKLLNMSPQKLNHRIKVLEKSGFIEPYVCIDYPLLNIKSFLLFFNTHLNDEESKALEESKNTLLFMQLIGVKRSVAIIVTENIIDFCKGTIPENRPEIYELTEYHPDNWNGYDVKPVVRSHQIETRENKMDKKDYAILYQLSQNPTASFLTISQETNISRQTVLKKMKMLEKRGIIQSYKSSVNLPKGDVITYFIHFSCTPKDTSKILSIIKSDRHTGSMFQAYNNLFFHFACRGYKILSDFIQLFKDFQGLQPEIFQATGEYVVNSNPQSAKETLKERSQK